METWLGKNQYMEDVVVNLQDNPSIYLDGKPGSGKTIALIAILYGYLKGIKEKVDVVIVTTKPSDFYNLFNNTQINLTLIDPFDGDLNEQLRDIIETFAPIVEAERSFKEAVKNRETDIVTEINLEALRRQGICDGENRRFYISMKQRIIFQKTKLIQN